MTKSKTPKSITLREAAARYFSGDKDHALALLESAPIKRIGDNFDRAELRRWCNEHKDQLPADYREKWPVLLKAMFESNRLILNSEKTIPVFGVPLPMPTDTVLLTLGDIAEKYLNGDYQVAAQVMMESAAPNCDRDQLYVESDVCDYLATRLNFSFQRGIVPQPGYTRHKLMLEASAERKAEEDYRAYVQDFLDDGLTLEQRLAEKFRTACKQDEAQRAMFENSPKRHSQAPVSGEHTFTTLAGGKRISMLTESAPDYQKITVKDLAARYFAGSQMDAVKAIRSAGMMDCCDSQGRFLSSDIPKFKAQ